MVAFFLAPLYLLANFYVLRWLLRFAKACFGPSGAKGGRAVISVLYLSLCLSALIAFLLPASPAQRIAAKIGNCWLGAFLYLLMAVFALDLLRILAKRNSWLKRHLFKTRKTLIFSGLFCLCFVTLICLYGGYNAGNIRTTTYDVSIEKEGAEEGSLKVVLAADLHMGYNTGYRQIEKLADKINALEPDLVCLAGDLFDNQYEALDDPERIKKALRGIRSRYGVYACYGNHDYEERILAGFTFPSKEGVFVGDRMRKLLEDSDIKILEDEAVLIDGKFYLAGRKDYSSKKKSGDVRKSPEELLKGLDKTKPVLVMDHQPRELEELSEAGADLDLCGHTHDGQIFPGNLLTRLMWENSYGYLKAGDMHNIVTSGAGVFGPYMRIGTKSEIVEINIDFR